MRFFIGILLASIFTLSIGLDEATTFFQQKKYKQALQMYEKALISAPKKMQAIHYNMAICYLKLDSVEKAATLFHQVLEGDDSVLRSLAFNQLGVRNAAKNKPEDALYAFHKAILFNSENKDARYNYELLLKKLPKNEQQPPNPQDKPEQQEENEDTSDQQNNSKTVEYWEEKLNINKPQATENQPNRPFSDSIPMERAVQLLEQMKKDEVKFLQQLRKTMSEEHRSKNQSQW